MLEDHVGAFHDLLDALDLLHARVDVLEDHGDVLYDVLDTLVHVPATCHLPPATDDDADSPTLPHICVAVHLADVGDDVHDAYDVLAALQAPRP